MDRSDSPQNMRQSQRHSMVQFIWYRLLEGEGAAVEGVGRSCDLSLGGVGMYTTRPLPSGALVFLEIAAQELSLSAVGRVCHLAAEGEGHRVGVSFIVVPPNDRVLLKRLCKSKESE